MTSVVAMTEPFDAQMLDEPSDDMDMDAILDPWPHEMETDDHFSHEEPYNNDGVEMDLDAYQEDQEYEMSEADHDFSGEMLDVEETEPSENQVPINIFSLTAPTADSAHLTTTSIETPFHSLLPTVRPDPIVADAGYDAVAEAHDLAQPTVDDAALTNVETLVEESTESVSEPDELHPELSTEEVSADVGDPSATFPVVDVADSQATGAHDTSLSSEAVADDAQATWQEPDAPHPEMDEATATDVPKTVASPDPHEISAGVFIEPPPGIMLSFVGVDHPDACLFNQPSVASSSSAESPDLLVFLEDRPTLYYEPLNVVFDALRNDTNFSSLVDLSSSELVLDAYDLQLVISEDNIYAREATLHELNVIHDAAGGSGPLRLRLRTVVPRFIWRYRYLQAEINRLQLTGEDNETNQEQDQPGEENSTEQEAELEQVDNGPDQPNEEEVENDDPEPEDDSREEPEPAEAEEPQGHSNDVENPDLEDDITTTEDANQTFDAHDAQEEEYIDSLAAEASTEDDSNLDSSAPVADAVDENAPDADTSVVGEREKSHETSPNHEDVPADVADDLEDPHVIPDDIPPLPDDDDDDDDDEDLEDLGNDEESSAQEVVQTDPAADYEEQEISENAENEDASQAYEDDPTEEPLVQEETKEFEETHAPAEEGGGEWDADDYSEEYDGEHHEEDTQEEDQNSWDQETISNQSSATLASRTSKRSIGEVEADEPDFEDSHSSPGSPGNKRPRIDHSSTSTVEDVE